MKNIKEYIETAMEQYWEYLPDASKPFKDWTDLEKETYYRYTEIEKVLFFIEEKLKNLGEGEAGTGYALLSDVRIKLKPHFDYFNELLKSGLGGDAIAIEMINLVENIEEIVNEHF